MTSRELAEKISAETQQFPAVLQSLAKTVIETLKTEIKEGRILLADLLESEDKFFSTITDLIDLSWDSGIFDPFDGPVIRKFVEGALRPILVRCLGPSWLEALRKMLG